jgi:hypothetical protein
MSGSKRQRLRQNLLFWLVVVIIAIYTLFPFYWAVVS